MVTARKRTEFLKTERDIREEYGKKEYTIAKNTLIGIVAGFLLVVGGTKLIDISYRAITPISRMPPEVVRLRDARTTLYALRQEKKRILHAPYKTEALAPHFEAIEETEHKKRSLDAAISILESDIKALELSDAYRVYITPARPYAHFEKAGSRIQNAGFLFAAISLVYQFIARNKNARRANAALEALRNPKEN